VVHVAAVGGLLVDTAATLTAVEQLVVVHLSVVTIVVFIAKQSICLSQLDYFQTWVAQLHIGWTTLIHNNLHGLAKLCPVLLVRLMR
jgi:hypothetical protein